ncbi:GSCOCG00010937001-RA-CDS [Cotesia congregata]|nr:GSCOCG00010937001-RA-CDS [Cotesia congregata]
MANLQTPQTQSSQSYSNVTQADCFPKKDQTIIIDVLDNTQLKDYNQALAKVIPPALIRFVSRIANNRVYVYVATKELADELVDKHKVIKINDQLVPIRPLITRNKRIILSNVCPVIPHHVLIDKLKDLNIIPASPITFLRAGLTEPGFNHILSFRRQLYVTPDDVNKIPESLQITFEETKYWIYLTTDTMTCFLCKQEGHIAKQCPNSNNKDTLESYHTTREIDNNNLPHQMAPNTESLLQTTSTSNLVNSESSFKIHPRPPSSGTPSVQANPNKANMTTAYMPPPLISRQIEGQKRAHSSTIESTSTEFAMLNEMEGDSDNSSVASDLEGNWIMPKLRGTKKKPKTDIRTDEQVWEDLNNEFKNPPESFPLSLTQFRNLIDSAKGQHNPDLQLNPTNYI